MYDFWTIVRYSNNQTYKVSIMLFKCFKMTYIYHIWFKQSVFDYLWGQKGGKLKSVSRSISSSQSWFTTVYARFDHD